MTRRRSREPALWLLFSAGGMLTALVLPVLVALLWVAPALGWTAMPSADRVAALVDGFLGRLAVFGLVVLGVFHWAHRFRYTLYDGLQLYHLNQLIAVLTYGVATTISLLAAVVVWG